MSKKPYFAQKKTTAPCAVQHCGDCALSFDHQIAGADGRAVFCRCPHRKDGGRYLILTSDRACARFAPRTDDR